MNEKKYFKFPIQYTPLSDVHMIRDRAMYETLCTYEDLCNIIMENDEKKKVQRSWYETIKHAINVRYVTDASKNVYLWAYWHHKSTGLLDEGEVGRCIKERVWF